MKKKSLFIVICALALVAIIAVISYIVLINDSAFKEAERFLLEDESIVSVYGPLKRTSLPYSSSIHSEQSGGITTGYSQLRFTVNRIYEAELELSIINDKWVVTECAINEK